MNASAATHETNPQDNCPPRKSLRRQFSWTLPANAIYGSCGLVLLVVLNKWGSTAVAGDFSLALAIAAPVFMFANLRFSTVLATDMSETVRLADYFRLRVLLMILAIALIAAWSKIQGDPSIGALIAVITLLKTAESISELCCGVQQRIERMDRIAISLTANGIAASTSFAVTYFATRNLTFAATSMLLARLIVLLGYDLPAARIASRENVFQPKQQTTSSSRVQRQQSIARMRMLLLSAAPLGVTAALVSLTLNIPRYVISDVWNRETLGLFASVAVILQAGALIFRAVEQPAMPRLAQFIDDGDAFRFWKLLLRLSSLFVALAVVCSVMSLLIGPQVLEFVFNANFNKLGGVLALMALATAVSQMAGLIESSLIAARITSVQVPMHCITVLACWFLCRWLIPTMELYGAVLAVAICRFPFMLIGVWLLRQKFPRTTSTATHDENDQQTVSLDLSELFSGKAA